MDDRQQLMAERLTQLTIAELELRGPMTEEVLSELVAVKFSQAYTPVTAHVVRVSLKIIARISEGRVLLSPSDPRVDWLVHLSENPTEKPRLPLPDNFIVAYYNLLDKYEAAKSGEATGFPEAIVDGIYGSHL